MTSQECESDSEIRDRDSKDSTDPSLRVCKHCSFSTSNTKEYLLHKLKAHNDTGDSPSANMATKPKPSHVRPSPGRHSSAGSNSQPPSPHRVSDSDQMDGEMEDDLMMSTEADDRDHGDEALVIGKAVLPIRTYTCQDCGMSTTSARVYLYHQLEVHKYDFVIYECDICDYATRYKQKLPRHRKCHFNNLRPGIHKSPQVTSVNVNNNTNINNNNTMVLPKKISGFNGPVFPGEPFIGDLDETEVDREMDSTPANQYEKEDATREQAQSLENTSGRKYVSVGDTMETIQLVDEFNNTSGNVGEGDLQIDMGQADDDLSESTPIKEKVAIKEGSASPSVLKPKPKRTTPVRQWVDPAKYITLTDEEGIKYSCSKCGNVYKWRKSLSKHWKEKHDNETPPPLHSRPNNRVNVLSVPKMSPPAAAREKKPAAASLPQYSPNHSQHSKYTNATKSSTPHQDYFSNYSFKVGSHPKPSHSPSAKPSSGMTPKPAHAVPKSNSSSSYTKFDSDALDLSVKSKPVLYEQKYESHSRSSSANSNIPFQDQPLDFSSKSSALDMSAHQNEGFGQREHPPYESQRIENHKSFQCSRCSYIAKSSDDFKRHFSIHSITRFEQCGQCNAQFASVDDLNRHFTMEHQEQLEDLIEEEESLLKSHLMAPPVSQQMASQSFKCMVCSTPYSSNYDLARHFNQIHSSLPNPYIKNNFLGVSGMKRSGSDRFEQPEPKRPKIEISGATSFDQGVHSCNMCGYSSSWRNDVMIHMRKYHSIDMSSKSHNGSPITDEQSMTLPTLLSSVEDKNSPESISISPATPQSLKVSMDSPTQASSISVSSQHQQYLADIPDTVDLTQAGTALVIPEAPEEDVKENSVKTSPGNRGKQPRPSPGSTAELLLPYKCSVCEYRARWPSEITQHMKNHSDEKPYCCPRCSYRSKWKWDVVKHLKRCGGGTIKDVIDTTKTSKDSPDQPKPSPVKVPIPIVSPLSVSTAPPNVTVVPGASVNSAPKPQGEDNEAHTKTPPSKQTVFRSIINQGQYHCMECPFIGSSPAELKRHVILHSDEKPFSCNDCSYSSRWKCDLKKHLRTYNHQAKVMLASTRSRKSSGKPDVSQLSPGMSSTDSYSGTSHVSASNANPTIAAAVLNSTNYISTSPSPSPTLSEMSEQSQKSILYQCEKCQYATYKKNFLESHMKIHSQRNGVGGKLQCKQCDYKATDLPSFLQHKLTHSQTVQDQAVDEPKDDDADDLSLKDDMTAHPVRHRRKPIRQYKCSKCPYVCFKKNGLELHEAMHEPRGDNAHKCMYCDYNVYNSSLLKQHLRLHPEHHQEQWGEDGEEIPEANVYDPWGMQQQTDTEEDNSQAAGEDEEMGDGYVDDCRDDADEGNFHQQVVTEEMSKRAAAAYDNTPNDSASEDSFGGSAVMDLTKKKSMFESSTVAMFNSSDYEDRLPQEVWAASYQCKECPFLTQHRSNYMKHIKMHGSNNKFTCEWCDWSIDRLNLLYRHAKCVHPEELAKQEKNDFFDKVRDKSPIVLNANPKPKKVKAVAPFYVEINKDHGASDLSMSNSPNFDSALTATSIKMNETVNNSLKSGSNREEPNKPISYNQSMVSSNSPSSHNVPEGVTVATGIGRKRKKLYTCRKCGYSTDILSNIQRHCEKHGQMARYMCDYCDYALDRQNLLWQHMKLVHKVTTKPEFMSPQSHARHPSEQRKFDTSANDDVDDGVNFEAAEETVDDSCIDLSQHSMSESQCEENTDVDMPTEGADLKWKGEVMQMYELDGKRVYRCAKCKYTSSSITNCSNHMKQHGAGKRYTCEYCDYSQDQVPLLYHHMKTVHKEEMQHFEAEMEEEPDESLSVEAYLNSNFHKKDNPQPAVSLLKSESSRSTTPVGVQRNSTEGLPPKRKMLQCHICPFRVKSKEAMSKHLSMHEQKRKYKCTYCDYSVDRMNLMYQHVRVHNQVSNPEVKSVLKDRQDTVPAVDNADAKTEETLPKVPPLKIITKPKNYVLQSQISKRIPNVKNRLRYGCSKCPYTSFCKSNIAKHRKLHIIRSKFKCHQCNYSATRWFLLNQHIKCHEKQGEDEDHIVYDSSPVKSEASETSLSSNLENSSDVAMNSDDVADKENDISPSDEQQADNDASQVNKSRSFMCKHCPFGTNSSFELKKHNRLHELSLKYKCDYCSYSLDRLSMLYQHRKLHSKQDGFRPNPTPRLLLNKSVWSNIQKDQLENIRKISELKQDDQGKNDDDDDEDMKETNGNGLEHSENANNKSSVKYECKMCPYRCNAVSKLKAHVLLHGVVRKFICDHCNWSSDRIHLLYQHRKVHRMESNFNMNAGEETFINESYAETQSSVKPEVQTEQAKRTISFSNNAPRHGRYTCDHCPFSCDKRKNLVNHLSLHENPGQYQCKECSYSVNRLNLLNQHERLHYLPPGGQMRKKKKVPTATLC